MNNIFCKHCIKTCKRVGKVKCDKFETESISELRKERNKLIINKTDPQRLEYIENKINKFDYGL